MADDVDIGKKLIPIVPRAQKKEDQRAAGSPAASFSWPCVSDLQLI